MLGRHLEYQSMKAVLLHMDANVRFQINLHMPSIRCVEKMVPLKIDYLEIADCYTKVNDNCYELGIHRHCPGMDAHPSIKLELEKGSRFDFDEFGFQFTSGENVLLPGDVSFREGNTGTVQFNTYTEGFFRNQLNGAQKALMILREFESRGLTVGPYLKILDAVPRGKLTHEEYEVKDVLYHHSSKDLPNRIATYQLKVLPFDCRKKNMKSPFTCYIRLTISKGKNVHVEWFEYTKKLFEASKHLHEVLFGGRTMPIRTGKFSYTNFSGILRLPIGFRLRVQKACLSQYTMTHKNFPLILENSENLNILELRPLLKELRSVAYECKIVRNAKRLIINIPPKLILGRVVPIISGLPNREIHLLLISQYSPDIHFTIIQAWLNGERKVGASLWMEFRKLNTVAEVLRMILTGYEKVTSNQRCIIVPLSNSISLEASYEQFEETSWILKLNVAKI